MCASAASELDILAEAAPFLLLARRTQHKQNQKTAPRDGEPKTAAEATSPPPWAPAWLPPQQPPPSDIAAASAAA